MYLQVAVEAANPEEYRVLARLALTTSTGAVQLWQQDQLQWTREEGLADIRVAELVELPYAFNNRRMGGQPGHDGARGALGHDLCGRMHRRRQDRLRAVARLEGHQSAC